jgi:hypothetical protein
MDDLRHEAKEQLVAWFKELFASRTPPQSVLDASPDYRVTWTEIRAKMMSLGWPGDVYDRITWGNIFATYKLRNYCNKLIRATGSKMLVSAESEASKANRVAY